MTKVTMKDIADELGCSINAVSLAVNDKNGVGPKLRAEIIETAQELGYFDQKPRYKNKIGASSLCLVTQKRYLTMSNFYSEILIGIQEEVANSGYLLSIEALSDETDILQRIRQGKYRGALILGPVDDTNLNCLLESGIPLILVDTISQTHSIDSIMTANTEGSFQLTDYLLHQGYQRFGFFGDLAYSASIRERYRGVIMRLASNSDMDTHLEIIQELNRKSMLDDLEHLIIDQDHEAIWMRLQEMNEWPEIFICSNDDAAAELILTLQKHDVAVPGELAVTGFDDSLIASRTLPALTTMRVEKRVMGREAVRRLLWRVNNPKGLVTRTSISTQLVVRESC